MPRPPLESLRVFRAVAELQSFARAAERLAMDRSQVSRVVRSLEEDLGRELLVRTTRSVRVTHEGDELLRRVAPALSELDAALRADARAESPEGRVVVATTADLGRALVAPSLARFRRTHPRVRVEVRLSDAFEDLLGDDVDLAVRVGRPGPASLVARKLGDLHAAFFASPAYLRRRGTPARVDELRDHDGLWPRPPRGRDAFVPTSRDVPPPSVECQDFTMLAELACAGSGIALLPSYVAAPRVASGMLVRILPSVTLGRAPLYLVSRSVRVLPPRVRALRAELLTLRDSS